MDASVELRMLADELRVLAEAGMRWSADHPYHHERFERARSIAARLFAFTDTRSPEAIERTVFSQLTHVAPVACGDGAVIDDDQRILLIQRADDSLWAMPGGFFEMGETPAEGVAREVLEEAGAEVDVTDLVGVYDSRFCETDSSIQLYQFVFLCRVLSVGEPSTPQEVLDVGWFREDALPPLSPGHTVRVPDVFRYLRDRRPHFDRPPRRTPDAPK